MFHQTLFLNTEDNKPTTKAGELVTNQKSEVGDTGQQPPAKKAQSKVKNREICDALLPVTNPWETKTVVPTQMPTHSPAIPGSSSSGNGSVQSSSCSRSVTAAYGSEAKCEDHKSPQDPCMQEVQGLKVMLLLVPSEPLKLLITQV